MDTPSGTEISLVPKPYNPKNGLTNGIVTRVNNNRFVFSLQNGHTHERQKRTNVYMAQRKFFSEYNIFDVTDTPDVDGSGSFSNEPFLSSTDDRHVGKICRIRSPSSYVGYRLFNGRGDKKHQVQSVLYQIPKTFDWLKGKTFRQCHVIFSTEESFANDAGGMGATAPNENASTKDKNHLKEAVKTVLTKAKKIEDIGNPARGIHVTSTKLPKYNPTTGTFTTNFAGRCQQSSQKNMQLSADAFYCNGNENQEVNLQIACWTTNEYSVDFTAPISPFQAFGFALAQFDL